MTEELEGIRKKAVEVLLKYYPDLCLEGQRGKNENEKIQSG
jgi:hypothetical protein